MEFYYDDTGAYYITPINPNCYPTYCIDCSDSNQLEFLQGLQDKDYFTQDEIINMFGGVPLKNPSKRTCYLYSPDGQRYKFLSILNDQNKMQNDGGLFDDRYEVGNDLQFINWKGLDSYFQ